MTAHVRLVLALCLLQAAGCSMGDDPAPQAETAAPGPPKKAAIALADGQGDAKGATKPFAYRPQGRRDPFRSYMLDAAARREAERGQRHLEETESFELSQYNITGVITGTSQPKAMVEDPSGKAHVVRIGARLGRAGGRISRIDSTGIVVLEETMDPQGQRQQVPISIKLPNDDHDHDHPGQDTGVPR